MINSGLRLGEEESNSLYGEEGQHLKIEKKLQPQRRQSSTADRASLYFAVLFVVIVLIAFFRAGHPPTQQITQQTPTDKPSLV